MRAYAIYDTKYYEQCIGIFYSTKEIAEYFNMNQKAVIAGMSRKHKIKARYEVVKMKVEKMWMEGKKNGRIIKSIRA